MRRTCRAACVPTLIALTVTTGCGGQKPVTEQLTVRSVSDRTLREAARARHALQRVQAEARRVRKRASERESPRDTGRLFSEADRASFTRLEARLGGRSGAAVKTRGQPATVLGTLQTAVAWSTAKVPVALAVVASGGKQRSAGDLRSALSASDNDAANRLFASLGSPPSAAAAVTSALRSAGDPNTTVPDHQLGNGVTVFGQTDWGLSDQVGFIEGLACAPGGPDVLALMESVVASQRWGLGAIDPAARFKGGWGPGTVPGTPGAYVDRQMGLVHAGKGQIAVAIINAPADGTHESGTQNLTAIARWLSAHVSPVHPGGDAESC